MNGVFRVFILAAGLAALALACGCEPSATKNRGGFGSATDSSDWKKPATKSFSGSSTARWPFWPVRMRVHPLTRLVTATGKDGPSPANHWIIETRVEFQDVDGLSTKACGQMTIQLYEGPTQKADEGRVKTWNSDLRDLAENQSRFDDVTRTYLFRLSIAPNELTEQSQLRVMFVSEDGKQFEDRLLVKH
jgi:hypothetical protein